MTVLSNLSLCRTFAIIQYIFLAKKDPSQISVRGSANTSEKVNTSHHDFQRDAKLTLTAKTFQLRNYVKTNYENLYNYRAITAASKETGKFLDYKTVYPDGLNQELNDI